MLDDMPAGAGPALDFDLLGSTGDVAAARRFSRNILAQLDEPCRHFMLAQLLLTASCLHMDASPLEEPTVERLHRLLTDLAEGRQVGFETSPMQFVQYVACEIAELCPTAFEASLGLATRAVTAHMH